MSRIIIAGADPSDLTSALAGAGATITTVHSPVTGTALDEAGLEDADMFVLTEHEEATSIPIARERRPDIEIVVYEKAGAPDFASHLADLILDPDAIDKAVVIEELLDRLDRRD